MHTINSINSIPKHLFEEKMPEKRLEQLLLPDNVVETCRAIIEEQMRADLLRSYGLEPRNKILLIGPPGNGKTSLAEAIAEALMVPLITVRYDTIIGAYLGETASRLSKLFEYASTRQCVLFFDEFDTIGKERGDQHETGLNRFVMTPTKWIEQTNAIGIVSKVGRYGGGTYAHSDIAMAFATWISPEFQLYS